MTDVTVPPPQAAARQVTPADVPSFAEHLLSLDRALPTVAVTTSASTGKPHLDPNRLPGLGSNQGPTD